MRQMFSLTESLLLLSSAALSSAAHLTVSIASSPLLSDPSTLPASTHAILVGPPGVRYDMPIRRDSTFVFPDLDAASYLLTLHSGDYFFTPLRIDVQQQQTSATQEKAAQTIDAWQTFRGNEWSNKGVSFGHGADALAIQIRPSSVKDYYQQRGGFNILGFLKSPMILMALVSMIAVFGMPYLMDNMDPEAKAEFEEMSKKTPLMGSGGAANSMQNFDLAGFLAGKSSAPAATSGKSSGSGGGSSGGTGNGSGSGRRR